MKRASSREAELWIYSLDLGEVDGESARLVAEEDGHQLARFVVLPGILVQGYAAKLEMSDGAFEVVGLDAYVAKPSSLTALTPMRRRSNPSMPLTACLVSSMMAAKFPATISSGLIIQDQPQAMTFLRERYSLMFCALMPPLGMIFRLG